MKSVRTLKSSRFLTAAILSFACLTAPAQDYRVLHHFAGGSSDGSQPMGSLAQSGSTLFGLCGWGGTYGKGVVFKINTDGGGFQVLTNFVSASGTGQNPYGSPLLSGTNLYATASSEGSGYGGNVFRIGTNGVGFQSLRRFVTANGVWPYGSLILSGTDLYGLNTYGGASSGYNGSGTIYRINTLDTNFQVLHTFVGGSNDGKAPHGTLLLSNTNLYGMTLWGGSSNLGTIFKIGTNGSDFQIVHHFAGGSTDGALPAGGALIQSGATLYGMARQGGTADGGAIFSVGTDGSNYQVLHFFGGGTNDGSFPFATLVQSGQMLYGMTKNGGTGDNGVIFQINTNGTGFQLLHRFTGSAGDGAQPMGSLIMSGTTLYGMTSVGGNQNMGVIFALDLPRPTLAISISDTNVNLSWNTNGPDFSLESTDQLTGAWTSVPGVTGYSATLPVSAGTNQFFRLKK